MWQAAERNYDGIQFESLRREIEAPYNHFHDELSRCYYDGAVLSHSWLSEWGYDTEIDFASMKSKDPAEAKVLFDELHGLQDMKRQECFHDTNMAKAVAEQIPEEKYNLIYDEEGAVIGKNSDNIKAAITSLEAAKVAEAEADELVVE